MLVNTKILKKRFEKSLSNYDENAIVQNIMADCLTKRISDFKKSYNRVLELGCGSGLLTKKLSSIITYNQYHTNDITDKAELFVKKIIPDTVFYCGNALKILPASKYDLVVSNAMFQWLDVESICEKCKNLLETKGILAFSTFSKENYKELKNLTGLSLDYKDLSELKEIFLKDFDILYSNQFEKKLDFNNPLELLVHMKHTGVNSLAGNSWNIADIKNFCDNYTKNYERVSLTYSPIIFIMQKR